MFFVLFCTFFVHPYFVLFQKIGCHEYKNVQKSTKTYKNSNFCFPKLKFFLHIDYCLTNRIGNLWPKSLHILWWNFTTICLLQGEQLGPPRQSLENKIYNQDRLDKAIRTFEPDKAAGPGTLKPIIIQKAWSHIKDISRAIMIENHSSQHIPTLWRSSLGIFFPKPGLTTTNPNPTVPSHSLQ